MTQTRQTPQMPRLDTEAMRKAATEMGRIVARYQRGARIRSAFGFTFEGDLDSARAALATLPADSRAKVAAAARQLAEMAEEGA